MSKRAPPPTLTVRTAVLCWNPGTDQVALEPWSSHGHRDRGPNGHRWACTGLAPFAIVHKMSFEQRKALVFIEAVHLIVRDRCDPLAVHRALLGLEEYQAGLAEDTLWEAFPGREGKASP